MIDPDEFASYEAWREHKLTSATDLSVRAYNMEQEAAALHWEEGVKAMAAGAIIRENSADVMRKNPYRAKGMTGERPNADAQLPTVAREPRVLEDPAPEDDDPFA